jgi:hypothetical protein
VVARVPDNPLLGWRARLRPGAAAGHEAKAARRAPGVEPTGEAPTPAQRSELPVPKPPAVAPLRLRAWRARRGHLVALVAAVLTMTVAGVTFFVSAGRTGAQAAWLIPSPSGDAVVLVTPEPAPTVTPPVSGVIPDPVVNIDASGFVSWAVLDRRTGARYGSENQNKTTFSESMIKAWIAADFLSLTAAKGATPDARRTDQLVRMIRDSHNGAAESLWLASGGDASIRRLIKNCGLVDTRVYPAWWSQTYISARDAVTMGECIANGTAAGPTWTQWLLTEMRNVRGTVEEQPNGGRWGIIDALPPDVAATVAIKNGWTWHKDNTWNVNCLAIHDDWILAVMLDYNASKGLAYGAKSCAAVAQQTLRQAAPA